MSKEVKIFLDKPMGELALLISFLIDHLKSSPPILSEDQKEFSIIVQDALADEQIRNVITQCIGVFVREISITAKV